MSRVTESPEPDAVDHLASPTIVTVNVTREPEHDARAAAAARRSPGGQQRGQHGQHAGAERGAGAGEEREEDEEDQGVRFNARGAESG